MPEVDCENCGETFDCPKTRMERSDNLFCSRECYHDFGRPDMRGENHHDHKGKVELECENCGDTFRVHNYRKDSARFCSRECSDEYKTTLSGEETGAWKGGAPEHTCENCGETFRKRPAKSTNVRFCSREGYAEAQSEEMAGDANHAWRGGWDHYYGANWDEQRQKAIERDDHTCQRCGKDADEMRRSPDVHHKKRLGWFKEEYDAPEWWEKGNRLENLTTLCPSCHMAVEWKEGAELSGESES